MMAVGIYSKQQDFGGIIEKKFRDLKRVAKMEESRQDQEEEVPYR